MDAFLGVFIQEVLPLSRWCKRLLAVELASSLLKRRSSLARVSDLRHFVVGCWFLAGWLAAGGAAVNQERMGRGSGATSRFDGGLVGAGGSGRWRPRLLGSCLGFDQFVPGGRSEEAQSRRSQLGAGKAFMGHDVAGRRMGK